MRGTLTIFRREFASLFFSPLAWILLVVSLFVNGVFFYVALTVGGGDVTSALELSLGGGWPFWAFLVFLPPLLTMRMLSEEARSGTLEYLLTAPVSDASVVIGKFLAATSFFAVLWSSILFYGAMVQRIGVPPDWGGVVGGYIGSVLVSGLFVAIGLLASSLTATPLLAAFLAFMADLWWLLLPMLAGIAMKHVRSLLSHWAGGVDAAESWINLAISKMNVISHFQASFLHGVLDTAEIVFFLTWTGFFLFLTVRSVEARRWRG
jgi:ABC-2 type transport system permease protein